MTPERLIASGISSVHTGMEAKKPETRAYEPCRSCCGIVVVITICPSSEDDKEIVLGTCRDCDSVRCRYTRLKRRPKGTT